MGWASLKMDGMLHDVLVIDRDLGPLSRIPDEDGLLV